MESYSRIYMPALICGRGSLSFVKTLGRKRAAVIGYNDSVCALVKQLFADTDIEVKYITTIDHEPLISDIYNNLPAVAAFEPDLILAIGGGSVMDVTKALHLFYENPFLSFEDSLKPFTLPQLGTKAISVSIPTTSGTGSEASSAAVFIDQETNVKKLMLANTLIPHYAVLDPDLTDHLPASIQIATGLDALCHAVESATSRNANLYTRTTAIGAALDILEYLPIAVSADTSEARKRDAKEKLHIAASLAGIAITNSCTGIVHSYDHPGPAFHLPHGIVCGTMLPHSMKLVGPTEEYACIAKRLGYTGDTKALTQSLIRHIQEFNTSLGIHNSFADMGVDKTSYFEKVPAWARISIPAFATQMSPAGMDEEKGHVFYEMCYYGTEMR